MERRIHVCRDKFSIGGHIILATDFPILVSEFNSPLRAGRRDAADFSIPVSNFKSPLGRVEQMTNISFQISKFPFLASKSLLPIPRPPLPRF